jgi:RNA polymerase sigma-70 factor (ECF subfamily)
LLKLKVRQMQLDPRFQARFDSSDLVQETLLRACQNLDQFRGQTDAEWLKWLDVILSRAVIDKVREATGEKRNVYLEQALQALMAESSVKLAGILAADQSAPSGQVERKELLLHVADAMDRLPDDQRDAILLRYGLGAQTPVDQIAAKLERSSRSVSGLLRRGLEKLRQLLAADK